MTRLHAALLLLVVLDALACCGLRCAWVLLQPDYPDYST